MDTGHIGFTLLGELLESGLNSEFACEWMSRMQDNGVMNERYTYVNFFGSPEPMIWRLASFTIDYETLSMRAEIDGKLFYDTREGTGTCPWSNFHKVGRPMRADLFKGGIRQLLSGMKLSLVHVMGFGYQHLPIFAMKVADFRMYTSALDSEQQNLILTASIWPHNGMPKKQCLEEVSVVGQFLFSF